MLKQLPRSHHGDSFEKELSIVNKAATNIWPCVIIIIIDRFYIALFSALEQTHCARMWFYMSK